MRPVAVIRSMFTDKLGIPRQAALVEMPATVVLLPPFDHADAVAGLERFSHLWLLPWFHALPPTAAATARLQVRPPKLGGQRRVGVFASRSPYRPNPIGLSAVRLERIEFHEGVVLHISGADLLDGTPILDIKPYLPYADRWDATGGYAPPITPYLVEFTPSAVQFIEQQTQYPLLRQWLTTVVGHDPRPGYDGHNRRPFHFRFGDFDVTFCAQDDRLIVTQVIDFPKI